MDKCKFKKLFFFALLFCLSIIICSSLSKANKNVVSIDKKRIILRPEMVLNETVYGNAEKLVDEQNMIVSPVENDYEPTSIWKIPSNRKSFLPFSAVIDLGQYYFLTDIYLYDAEGKGEIVISTGEPFQWKEKSVEKLEQYKVWKHHIISDTTRFIQIKLKEMISTPEILAYGIPIENNNDFKKRSPNQQSFPSRKSMDKLIGANVFIDDPIENIKAVGFIREYHSWAWDEANVDKNAFAPSYAGGGTWNFDEFYKAARNEDIDILSCVQGSVDWIPGGRQAVPVFSHMDPTLPSSYVSHSTHMFQTVARYGSSQVPDSLLKLREDQKRISGMNIIHYYENWNEPNNDWSKTENYFTPYEFAAMCSADYDGHLATLGNDKGVKNAAPKAKMVMGGLASVDLKYLKAMMFWSDYNRRGNLPFDIINFHHYSNNKDGGGKQIIHGISPEEDSLRQKLQKVVNFRNSKIPEKEVWLTEFGYDTHKNSPQRAIAIGNTSNEEVQAIWLVRSFLAIAASGIDRASLYMMRDVNSESGKKFSTSGITTSKALGQKPKIAWYYIYTLKESLKGMFFKNAIETKDIFIYCFANQSEEAYVVWMPTSANKQIENYKLPIKGKNKNVDIINFSKNNIFGEITKGKAENGYLTITISETPTIVKLNN